MAKEGWALARSEKYEIMQRKDYAEILALTLPVAEIVLYPHHMNYLELFKTLCNATYCCLADASNLQFHGKHRSH